MKEKIDASAGEKVSGYNKFLKIIYIVCGLFGFIAYLSYFLKFFMWPEGTGAFIVAICGMIVAGVPVFFRRFFVRRLPHRVFKILENIFGWGMLFYTVTFLMLVGYIFGTNSMQSDVSELPEQTVFVVYGAGIRGDRPGSVLRKRLNKTIEYMEQMPDSVCIVSGAQGADEDYPEAEVMFNYLVDEGIEPERIFQEPYAKNTIQNIKNSKEIIEKEGLSGYHFVSVSNAFHIPRIKLICARLGVDGSFILAKDPNPYAMFTALVREYMSYTKLFITGAE